MSGKVNREIVSAVSAPAGLVEAAYLAVPAFSVAAVKPLGEGCPYPGSFQIALLAIVSYPTFVEAFRANVMVGGDQCSRSMFLGSVLGAAHGIGSAAGIPLDWIERTTAGAAAFEQAINLVSE